MSQLLEKRMADMEYMIARLPHDLNARFEGVDVKFANLRETQILYTERFSTFERRIDVLENWTDGLYSNFARREGRLALLETKLNKLEERMDKLERLTDKIEGSLEKLDERMDGLEMKVDSLGETLGGRVDMILARLPPP
ncbi:MAG: hypothetical protein ACM3L9_05270 [Deltaproteobacteria bacterium]